MTESALFRQIPAKAGIYALCGGHGKSKYVAYVGGSKNIRRRITQHLIYRNSSVVTGVSAASLNPEKVTEVRWWLIPKALTLYLEEAEVIAFELLDPVLRSRGAVSPPTIYSANQPKTRAPIEGILKAQPSGKMAIMTYADLASRVMKLERQVHEIARHR